MVAFLDVLNIVATVTTVLLVLSPFPDFRRIHTEKSTGEVRILPVLMLCANCYTWSMYGYLTAQYFPVMSVNAFGALSAFAFSLVFYRWSSDRPTLNKQGGVVIGWAIILLAFAVLGKTEVIPIAENALNKIVGYLAVAINICLYASPLKTMGLVLRTKSAASLPVAMCSVNLVNGTLWVLYGIISNDMFVMTPNAIGVALSAIQVALCVKFRGNAQVVDDPMEEGLEKGELSVTISQAVDGVPFELIKSPVFEPIKMPLTPPA